MLSHYGVAELSRLYRDYLAMGEVAAISGAQVVWLGAFWRTVDGEGRPGGCRIGWRIC